VIAKLLHEGETRQALKSIIKYNTVAKEYLNSGDNPRLLQATSNLGIIDITDKENYQYFMDEFIDEICLNKSLSNNKRQKKLYAHEVISFEDEDNKKYSEDELAQIAIETLNTLYDMENTPYVIWKQKDSGRLHYHVVRGSFSNKGVYQRVKNSRLKMRQSVEAMECKYNFTLTGKNVSNEIRPTNDPMLKVFKNRRLEAEYNHQKNISEAIKQDTPIGNIKRKTYDLLMDDIYQNKAELAEQQVYQTTQQTIDEKTKINNELETIKNSIFTIYKKSKGEEEFIKSIESNGIRIELLKHSKTGINKGIVFHHNGQVISGSKISNSMTLGKIKKRYPNFIHSLEKPPSLRSTHKLQRKMLDFNIEQINKYYKQRKNNNNNDILIYFGKKNVDARPYNYNLKLSSTRDLIRFGPSKPNDHDLTLCIGVALEHNWQSATLSSSSPDFLKRMMKAAYKKDPELLFFIKSDKPHQLTYNDLKEIKTDLTADDLKTAIKHKLISETDLKTVHQDLITLLKPQTNQPEQQGYGLALEKGFTVEALDKKTAQELQQFYHHNSFEEPTHNTAIKAKSKVQAKARTILNDSGDREACLNDIKTAVEIEPKTTSNAEYTLKANPRINPSLLFGK